MARIKVAILGCGPTGLLAAHGATMAGEATGAEVEISIFSRKRKSGLFGCQYLHSDIPGLNLRGAWVHYELRGPAAGYRSKIYGGEEVEVSPEALDQEHGAWDIRQAYDQLWDDYEPAIHEFDLTHASWLKLHRTLRNRERFDLVINSVPAPALCGEMPGCTFTSAYAYAMGDAPELGRMVELPVRMKNNWVVCNGKPEDQWYRISKVFNRSTIEYPAGGNGGSVPPLAAKITKPIDTTCVCNPDVLRVGRYGTWTKGVLADSAFHYTFREVAFRAQ